MEGPGLMGDENQVDSVDQLEKFQKQQKRRYRLFSGVYDQG